MRWNWIGADNATLSHALAGCTLGGVAQQTKRGGRTEALRALDSYDPSQYGRTRNHVDAPVSQLSAFLRHGCLDAVEVRANLQSRFGHQPEMLEEFLRQLAWRDFFEKVLDYYGTALNDDLEEPKHSVPRTDALPADIARGNTGLPCMDGMLSELFTDGYLHNHERLWFAAYVCHFRGVHWKHGAKLFRQYLYDGDTASNASSWQWVESTFASKPYFMNAENIAKFSSRKWCATCTVKCPFDADYPTLERRLFNNGRAPLGMMPQRPQPSGDTAVSVRPEQRTDAVSPGPVLVWLHDASLSPTTPAVLANPEAARVFVWDTPALQEEPWAFHRLAFVSDSVRELLGTDTRNEVLLGEPGEQLLALAHQMQVREVHVTDHPNPQVRGVIEFLKRKFRVVVHPRRVLSEYTGEPRRFSKYWERCAEQVLGYHPKRGPKKIHQ